MFQKAMSILNANHSFIQELVSCYQKTNERFLGRKSLFFALFFLFSWLLILRSHAIAQEDAKISLMQAVRYTLKNQSEILLGKEQVNYGEGNLQYTQGQFDVRLDTAIHHTIEQSPYTKIENSQHFEPYDEQRNTIFTLGLVKQFRTGVSVSPSIAVTRKDDATFDLVPTRNDTKLRFTITTPLLKGFGYAVAGAQEKAAKENLERLRLTLRHKISESIKSTTIFYWNYIAAEKKIGIYKESEEAAKKYLKNMKRLIDTDQKPAAELDQLIANLASKKSARLSAEKELVKARQSLGLAMGVEYHKLSQLSTPYDDFPELRDLIELDDSKYQELIEMTRLCRADLRASELDETKYNTLTTAAIKDKKPKLDLVLSAGYNGLDEGDRVSNAWDSIADSDGYYVSAALQGEYFFVNNTAKGLVGQNLAKYHQAVISTTNLHRNIQSDLIIAIEDIKRSAEALESDRISVSSYRRALENEIKKIKLSISTVSDVIIVKDRLIRELLQEITSHQNYANALVSLRYVTGTILSTDTMSVEVSYDKLTTIPAI